MKSYLMVIQMWLASFWIFGIHFSTNFNKSRSFIQKYVFKKSEPGKTKPVPGSADIFANKFGNEVIMQLNN